MVKCLHNLFQLLRVHSYSDAALQYDNFSLFLFKVFLIATPSLIYVCGSVLSHRTLSSIIVSAQLQLTKYFPRCFFHHITFGLRR